MYVLAAAGAARLWYAASRDAVVPGSAGENGGASGHAIDVGRDVAREFLEAVAGLTDRVGIGVAAVAMTTAFVLRLRRVERPSQAQRASDVAWTLAAVMLGGLALADAVRAVL